MSIVRMPCCLNCCPDGYHDLGLFHLAICEQLWPFLCNSLVVWLRMSSESQMLQREPQRLFKKLRDPLSFLSCMRRSYISNENEPHGHLTYIIAASFLSMIKATWEVSYESVPCGC